MGEEKEVEKNKLLKTLENFGKSELKNFRNVEGGPPLSDFISYRDGKVILASDFRDRYLVNGSGPLTEKEEVTQLKEITSRLRAYNLGLSYP